MQLEAFSYKLSYLKAVLLPTPEHLGQLYKYRHPGWPIIAHATRATRCLTRVFTPHPADT